MLKGLKSDPFQTNKQTNRLGQITLLKAHNSSWEFFNFEIVPDDDELSVNNFIYDKPQSPPTPLTGVCGAPSGLSLWHFHIFFFRHIKCPTFHTPQAAFSYRLIYEKNIHKGNKIIIVAAVVGEHRAL